MTDGIQRLRTFLAGPETTHLIEHGFGRKSVIVHVMHDTGGGAWDACLYAKFDVLDLNNILVELRDPEHIHQVIIIG